MSGTSLLHPQGAALQGNNLALPPGGQPGVGGPPRPVPPGGLQGPTQGRGPGAPPRISLSGPSMGQMQDMVNQGQGPGGGPPPIGGPNALGGGPPGLPGSFMSSRGSLVDQHDRNKAAYQQSGVLLKRMDAVRAGLDRLAKKQDMVTMEDIVHEAGQLVGHGIDPVALAGILADAPQTGGGEALAGWIAHQDGAARQREQQLQTQHRLNQHQMGVSAMQLLMAHANARAMMGQPQSAVVDPSTWGQNGGENGAGNGPPGGNGEEVP